MAMISKARLRGVSRHRVLRVVLGPAVAGALLGVAAASAHDVLKSVSMDFAQGSAIILTQADGATPVPPRRPPLIESFPAPPPGGRFGDPSDRDLRERFRQRAPGGDTQRAAPRGDAAQPQSQAPAQEAKKPQSREEMLEDLYGRLSKAKDANEARGIAQAIERMWLVSGSSTTDLLMTRVQEAVQKKNHRLAIRLLDKIVEVQPGWSEGWNQRATIRFRENDLDGAIADIAKVLEIEPRHFRALSGLGFIMKHEGFNKQALQALRKALEINPQQERIRKEVETLTQEVEGRDI
ncbi:MAG: tetratricopeptide repeat protein [Alphaproteobacteria bacterium]|nr:tetratricopeptide repeat protein [Alphaproteobacteria bacterium]